jgi:hypothetical protein
MPVWVSPEIQDTLVSVLSEKLTANARDRGVHEMSSAVARRFNLETAHPIQDSALEVELVIRECQRLLKNAAAPA